MARDYATQAVEAMRRVLGEDALPTAAAFANRAYVEQRASDLESAAKAFGVKQTVKLTGNPFPMFVTIDPKEPLPAAVSFPVTKSAPPAELKAILQELALPPLFTGEAFDPIPPLPFDPMTLKPYLPEISVDEILRDAEKYPLNPMESPAPLNTLSISNWSPLPAPTKVKPPPAKEMPASGTVA